MSSKLQSWLDSTPDASFVPLFEADASGRVATRIRNDKELLCRSEPMEHSVINIVETGLTQNSWQGILYIMCWGGSDSMRPLYIGKAGRRGRKNPVSANIRDIRRNRHKFARWGDGMDYHVGELSQVLFGWKGYRSPSDKYRKWAEMLFLHTAPPVLREQTSLMLIPWHAESVGVNGQPLTLEDAEELAIEVALSEFEDLVLNVEREQWWDRRANDAATPPSRQRGRPCHMVTDSQQLVAVVERLERCSRIGLDVETEMYTQRLCLVQLAAESETFLVDALSIADLGPLCKVLETPAITKIIHNGAFETRILAGRDIHLRGIYDTLKVSRDRRGRKRDGGHGLAAVCQRELNEVISKGQQKSNWKRRPLSQAQLDYAALDAEVLLRLHDVFESPNQSGGLL